MSTSEPIARESPGLECAAAALDLIPEAAVLVARDRCVLAANVAFLRSARRRAALPMRGHALHAAHASTDEQLGQLLHAVSATRVERVCRALSPDGGTALELRISPFAVGGLPPLVAIVVHDPIGGRGLCAKRLRELHDLTRAEADVAVSLASGATLDGAAHALGVSVNTVRTHVRHLFDKFAVQTQGALLQRLALGAARTHGTDCDDQTAGLGA